MLKSDQSGFTITELLVGAAILGILAAVALPSFRVWLQNLQIRNAAESIQNGLQIARATAVNRNANTQFVLCPALDSSWDVLVASTTATNQPCAADGAVGWERIQNRPSSEGSRNILVAPAPGGSTTVTYNNFGGRQDVNPMDGSAPFTQVDVDSPMLSVQQSRDLRIVIQIGGNVRMCDPNAPATSTLAC